MAKWVLRTAYNVLRKSMVNGKWSMVNVTRSMVTVLVIGCCSLFLFAGCARRSVPVLYDFVLNPSFTGNTSAKRKSLGVESVSMYSYDTTKAGRTLWQEDVFDNDGRLQKRIYFDPYGQPEKTSYYEYVRDDLPWRMRTETAQDTTTWQYFYNDRRQPAKSVLRFGNGQQVEYVYTLTHGGKQLRADVMTVKYPNTDSASFSLAFTDLYILNKKKQPEQRLQLSPTNDTLAKNLLSYNEQGQLFNTVSFQFHRIESADFVYDDRGLLIAKHYSRNGQYNGSDLFEYKFRK